MKRIKTLEKQLERKLREVRKQRKKLADLKAEKERKRKAMLRVKKPGRPSISKEKILEVELDAYDRPLRDVSLKHNIGLATLYRYGITRKALNRKIAGNDLSESGEKR